MIREGYPVKKERGERVCLESERFNDVNRLNSADCGFESFVSDFGSRALDSLL